MSNFKTTTRLNLRFQAEWSSKRRSNKLTKKKQS